MSWGAIYDSPAQTCQELGTVLDRAMRTITETEALVWAARPLKGKLKMRTIMLVGVSIVVLIGGLNGAMGKIKNNLYPGAEYPVPGGVESEVTFLERDKLPKKANKSYPAWFRGNGEGSHADSAAQYFYREMIGPKKYVQTGMNAENLYMGTLTLKPGAVYPAHNHPSRELYFVISGQAEWWVNHKKKRVSAGDTILHRPYDVHGWTNVSDTEELHLLWLWWKEPNDDTANFDKGARFVNPKRFEDPKLARPHAVPIPQPRTKTP